MRRTLVALAVVALMATGCGTDTPSKGVKAEPKSTKLKDAYDGCQPMSPLISLGDGNTSLLVSGIKAGAIADVACVMVDLDTPQYIIAEVDNTTAMMGRQHEEDGGLSYEWSYHPDNGLDMVIHED